MSERKLLWGLILLYIAVFGVIVSLRHYNFQTQTWDLAAFVQSFWNAAEGRGLVNNLEQVHNHLGLHFSPGLFLFVPGYALFQSPYFLLIAQTIALALGALPVYFLAKRKWQAGNWPLILAGAYLLFPSLHWTNLYDFHEISFFAPAMLAAIYFLEEKRWGWMAAFLALAASMKEDAILAVFFAGIYLLVKKEWKVGSVVAAAALAYFVLATQVFMPALGGGVLRFDRYANLGETPAEAVRNVAVNPALIPKTILTGEKLSYLFWLFLPAAFLPLFSPAALIFLLPGLPENLLTDYRFQFSGLYHYDAILIPAVFAGLVFGLARVLQRWPSKEKVIRGFFIAAVAAGFLFRSPLGVFSFPSEYFSKNPQWEDYRRLAALAPEGVSVAANTNIVPHIAHREFVFPLRSEPALMDMVIIDTADLFQFKDQADLQSYIDSYLQTGLYQAKVFNDRYVVIIRNSMAFVTP